MNLLRLALFAFGYPTSIVVIVRWIPVVRERRTRWFLAHQVAVAAIVTGWAISHDWRSVAVNGTWLAIAAAWYGHSESNAKALRNDARRES